MHSGLSRSFRSILGSIPVIQVYPGSCIRVHPGHSGLSWFMHSGPSRSFRSILVHAFGSIPVTFRSILVHAFGSIPVTFRSILVHAFGSIPVIQVYPGSCIRVHLGHIQVYSGSCIRVYPSHSGLSWFMHSGLSRSHSGLSWFIGIRVHPGSNFPHNVPMYPSKARAATGEQAITESVSQCIQARREQPRGSSIRAVAGPQKGGASYNLWLHPLTEHATKEGQAVSTLFWPTGFLHENPRPKTGLLFITRQSEANVLA
ncbi:hypothetical protein CDL15_Pgr010106 [Punica granatum]|uniref:Uncharacterized protein n=1 Tax=Punica granatum TaxID=22663 RepID=A0A218WWT7_PUNGR|nr:hypothetical protein CDL15_Pgr010106 [Punica granatum]